MHAASRIATLLVGPALLGVLAMQLPSPEARSADEGAQESRPSVESALRRGLRYLESQIPLWHEEHGCASCHHDGDATRALLEVHALHDSELAIGEEVLAAMLERLREPEHESQSAESSPYEDPVLADLQFSAALATACATGAIEERAPLVRAAVRLGEHVAEDGRYLVVPERVTGAPVTWGNTLATVMTERVLRLADTPDLRPLADRCRHALLAARPERSLDAAALLLRFADPAADEAEEGAECVAHCTQLLAASAASSGGFGPFVRSPAEVFDTAVVLLALEAVRRSGAQDEKSLALAARIEPAIDWMIRQQEPDGSFVETTRPSGGVSLAQRVSTTAWALTALARHLAAERAH